MAGNVRPRPAILKALGHDDPPTVVEIDGESFQRVEIYKHDSWAASALYSRESSDRRRARVVCKFNRTYSAFGLPLRWLGRFLARRETFAYQRLSHIPGICESRAPVSVEGVPLDTVAAHDFVAGHPLRLSDSLDDAFFPSLKDMLLEMHRQGFAYVDLHKPENVLVGQDGLAHLIDFQICFYCSPWSRKYNPLARCVLSLLQHADLYHFAKHVNRMRPDQLEDLRLGHLVRPPFYIRAHRSVAVPFREMRRLLLMKAGIRDGSRRAHSEVFTEHALRIEQPPSPSSEQKRAA